MSEVIESKINSADFMFVVLLAGIVCLILGFWISSDNKDENNKIIDKKKETITTVLKIIGSFLTIFALIRIWIIFKSIERKILPGK